MTAIVKTAPAPRHPLAGTEMTCADMIIQVLADEGVDTIFGYSGGAILPTYDAIFRYNAGHPKKDEIRLIVPANEQGAGFMAAGYARSSGKVGVFLVTSGPGATASPTRFPSFSSAVRCRVPRSAPMHSRKLPSSTS
jgi:acetolactate synthase-1/2/3 large subunit